ncbi:LysR family transcriptional regulator [Saccharopolyspora taberi]|uniref:LysR family transcriptional regulator n=1 Tax=Saccharopolyspora taberi TaxID=60895 RepID=A0ABN3VHM4_9PSEU
MDRLEIRELECFLALAEELHFGRAAERLHVSQGRVSQLLRALERRIGATLVERTSRRVRLTPLGQRFVTGLRPAYDVLAGTVEDARSAARGVEGTLRIGFQGSVHDEITSAIALFQQRHPGCTTEVIEIPLADPFSALRGHEVDLAMLVHPVAEPDLVAGPVFSRSQQTLAVPAGHPLAGRGALSAEDLAECTLIGLAGPAPEYWRRATAPETTPGGLDVARGPRVCTLQEGLTLVAAGRGAMLLCQPTSAYHHRSTIRYVPVTGLPDSVLGPVWHRGHETARVRAFAQALAETAP